MLPTRKTDTPTQRAAQPGASNRPALLRSDLWAPLAVGLLAIALWDIGVRLTNTPPYLLPGPMLVLQALVEERQTLLPAMLITLQITVVAFGAAVVTGLATAILFAQSKWIERSFFPYAVILQTTPIVAIAPLIIIWLQNNTFAALVVCAWIVALFPIISNTTLGLNSADRNLVDLFKLYNASRWQTLIHLRLPSAMPYFFGGLRISGGLALIGAVVAEFVAGTGGARSGLAYQILISSYNLEIPRMFAALLLIAVMGVSIFVLLTWLSNRCLGRWHESSLKQDA